jgi:hypothetical protein
MTPRLRAALAASATAVLMAACATTGTSGSTGAKPASPGKPGTLAAAASPVTPDIFPAADKPGKADARPSAGGAVEADVSKAVQAWATAWSNKDSDAYLAAYHADFQPPGGLSREAWSAQRRDRISRPAHIRVQLVDLKVSLDGEDRAQASFRQLYASDRFRDTTAKVLTLQRQGKDWKIVQEQ